jgi:adenine-specific DNA-methyltransferase
LKQYIGVRTAPSNTVTVDGNPLLLRLDLRSHSPWGFEWGYEGSGSTQLALAIIADHLRDDARALAHYQEFKREVVSNLPHAEWTLTSKEIDDALVRISKMNGVSSNAKRQGFCHSFVNRVLHGDCRQVLRSMPTECIDLVVADPPYLVRFKTLDGRRAYPNDDDPWWLEPTFREIYRVLKQHRFCVCFYGWSRAHYFLQAWRAVGFYPISHLVFIKRYDSRVGFTRARHDAAFLLAKGRPARPRNPICDVLPWTWEGNSLHPAQKPVSVLRPLIQSFSEQGDIVLDPFAGSGSTGIAARREGRRFVLIEKVLRYYRVAERRIRNG